MAFTEFKIKNFKCFVDEQSLKFGIPIADKQGSGITYIVGVNNAGKTTILEALGVKKDTFIKDSDRVGASSPEFTLLEGITQKRKCSLQREGSYTIKEEPALPDSERFEIISSRRHWDPTAPSNFGSVGESIKHSHNISKRQTQVDIASSLKLIESDDTKYKDFISLVQRVIPEFTKFAIGYEGEQPFIVYVSSAGIKHKADMLGDGVITAIRILYHIFAKEPNPLIIDEPELSLHPGAQKRLLRVIAEVATTRQIVICTHSPYFVDRECLSNGASLNRVAKHEDRHSNIYPITNFNTYRSLMNGENWQQPFLFDVVAKEIFFTEDNIIFLEGQEDVGLLRDEERLGSAHIFGYGVRGAGNFELALTLAKDLGFKKVCCILDKGDDEDAFKESLTTNFGTEYKILQWNKNDIRDKAQKVLDAKQGYFDVRGTKKEAGLLDDFDAKLLEIQSYFR